MEMGGPDRLDHSEEALRRSRHPGQEHRDLRGRGRVFVSAGILLGVIGIVLLLGQVLGN